MARIFRRLHYYRRRLMRIFGLRAKVQGAASISLTLSIVAAAAVKLAGAVTVGLTLTVQAAGRLVSTGGGWPSFTTFTIFDVKI